MIELPTVELVVCDGRGVDMERDLITPVRECCRGIRFKRVHAGTPLPREGTTPHPGPLLERGGEGEEAMIRQRLRETYHRVQRVSNGTPVWLCSFEADYEGWNRFMVLDLKDWISDGHHALYAHSDGYVLNPAAWRDEWLEWDYIGAPWTYTDGINVGNGGFSLRSKRYLEASAEVGRDWAVFAPEDHRLIREHGDELVRRGIRFAPEEVARAFSMEGNEKRGRVWNGEFGFHGAADTTDIFTEGNEGNEEGRGRKRDRQ